jgi:uncharacterized protein (DUF169 family)
MLPWQGVNVNLHLNQEEPGVRRWGVEEVEVCQICHRMRWREFTGKRLEQHDDTRCKPSAALLLFLF